MNQKSYLIVLYIEHNNYTHIKLQFIERARGRQKDSMKKIELTEQYFVRIVEEEKDLMFRLAYNIMQNTADSEDVVAESICKAWEKRDSLKNPAKLRNWMLRITVNLAKNAVTIKNRTKLVEDCHEYYKSESDEKMNIWELVRELKEKESTVITLYYYKGFSVKEIARILRIPEGTVKSKLSQARKHLKDLM